MKIFKLSMLCVTAAIAFGDIAAAQSLGIGAGRQGSQNYASNAGLASFLTEEAGMDLRVQSYGGSGQSMPLIDAGRLDLQLVPSPEFEEAAGGKGAFKGRQLSQLRVLASLSPSVVGFMVRADSPYTKVSDIAGKTITYGYSAQPNLVTQVNGILAAAGLSIDEMEPVMVPSVPNGVDEFIAGAADVAFFALQGGKTREADAAVGIRWLALDDTPEAEAAMQGVLPTGYIKTVEPGPTAVGVAEPTPMMGYDYVLVAGAHVSDEVVAKILGALHDDPDGVRAIRSTFSEFAIDTMAPDFGGLPYHPGAIAYYKSVGLMD
ncbi:TAXI family TRAP transporter solute-binding subunit [Salipiger abyssi]|uniref:TAXI family TRAP transporter solute-binding subunit n=1 Tax=Salipiger abyssi TaxID=1250539 RepID=UPI00405A3436